MGLLTGKMDTIAARVNLIPLLNSLLSSGGLSLQEHMELQGMASRSTQENLRRLFEILGKLPGARGFIAFVEALRGGDSFSSSHLELSQQLLEDAKVFLQEHPQTTEVSNSDRIELLQLASTKPPVISDREILTKFDQLETRLMQDLKLSTLLPYLQKSGLLSPDEADQVLSMEPQRRNQQVLEVVRTKGAVGMQKFLLCLRESPGHSELAALFEAPPPPRSVEVTPGAAHISAATASAAKKSPPLTLVKKDKLAVMVYSDLYYELTEEYKLERVDLIQARGSFTADGKPATLTDIRENRQKLEQQLRVLGFDVFPFFPTEEAGQMWKSTIAPMCSKGTILFLYISGIQYPYLVSDSETEYGGAVLIKNATTISRRKVDSMTVEDIHSWIEALQCSATVVMDTHLSHAVSFGKLDRATESMVLENPWSRLTDPNSSTVVYSLQPDTVAMARLGLVDVDKSYGLLTEKIVEALHFLKRFDDVSHRAVYEAVSFHWNKKGRARLLFSPAVQGDLDREFLGRGVVPYQQLFRADLKTATDKKGKIKFNLSDLQLPIGTMAGLILSDELRVSHVLRPRVTVVGRVTKAYPLHCTAEVKKEDRKTMEEVLDSIYEELPLSKDGSTEFLYLRKWFPLHQRTTVFPRELGQSATESLKAYVRDRSLQLITTTKEEEAQVIVKKDGDLFTIVVRDDVTYPVKLRSIHQVTCRLEMLGWFKYVKSLKSTKRPLRSHACYLTAERELLSPAIPRSSEFHLQWSTFPSASSEAGHEAIIHFSSDPPQKFWQPDPTDVNPVLEVVFNENYIVTAIELRGDSEQKTHVSKADIWRQKLVYSRSVAGPTSQGATPPISIQSDDPARFISFKPEGAARPFSLSIRLWYRVPGGKSARLEQFSIMNWPFYLSRKTSWRFVPEPDAATGRIKLSSSRQWITWSGTTTDALTLQFGSALTMEKIEFSSAISNPQYPVLEKLKLQLKTDLFKTELPHILSPLPKKHEFEQPLLLSNLQLWPVETRFEGVAQPKLDIKTQLQLYGNKRDAPLDVEEGDLLTLHFLNMSDQPLFMFVLCIEETGMVDLVVSEVVIDQKSCKKLLRTYIPKGLDRSSITDVYRVLVSPVKLYVEPFLQKGLHQYHLPSCYNVCSYGYKPESSKEDWYEHSFLVKISKK